MNCEAFVRYLARESQQKTTIKLNRWTTWLFFYPTGRLTNEEVYTLSLSADGLRVQREDFIQWIRGNACGGEWPKWLNVNFHFGDNFKDNESSEDE